MSHLATLDFKGERRTLEMTGATLFSPAVYKYYTLFGQFNSKSWLTAAVAKTGGAYRAAGTLVGGTAAPTSLLETTTAITPFTVRKSKIRYDIKNNYVAPCNLTIYELHPKNLLPDTIDAIKATAMTSVGEVLFRAILEGLADKFQTNAFSGASTSPFVGALHTVANAGQTITPAGSEIPSHIDDGLQPEMSLQPGVTIFDSAIFGQLFTVTKVEQFYLRPSDKITYVTHGPKVEFLDGIEPYLGAETLAHPFNKLILFELLGDPSHVTPYTIPGASGDTSLPHHNAGTYTFDTADKQAWHIAEPGDSALDVTLWREVEYDVYDATLMEPLLNIQLDGAFNHGDQLDSVLQSNMDLE